MPKHMISAGDVELAIEVRAHPKSRRLKLSFRPERGLLLTHPPRASKHAIREFLQSQQHWMRRVTSTATRPPSTPSLKNYLLEQPQLSLNGTQKQILFSPTSGLVNETDSTITFFPEITESQLARHLQQLAKIPLTSMLLDLSAAVGQPVQNISIRNQKTRWGSCSGKRSISLNWRLVLMPHRLQRHIMLHELAHIPHPNHSKRFWDCLKHWDSDTEIHRQQLRRDGSQWIALGR